MRIAILNWRDIHHPHSGGAEIVSHEQAKGLAARGHDVTLYTAEFPGCSSEEWIDGYRVRRQGNRFTVYSRTALRLARCHWPETPDVVLEHVTGKAWFAPVWSPSPTLAYFYHVIGPTYFQELPPPLSFLGWCTERIAPLIYRGRKSICPGEGTRKGFEAIGYRRADFEILPPGVPVDLLERGGPKSSAPAVVVLGRIKRYKRIDLAIEALAFLRQDFPELTLQVVGPDPDGLQRRLVSLAHRLGVSDAISFHGRVSVERRQEMLCSAWVNLVTSCQEGWGLTVLEAAASGTPSVGSDIPGLSDTLIPGVTGASFRNGDATDCARVLHALLANEEQRRSLGESARRFSRSLTWEAHVTGLERLLEELHGTPRAHPASIPALHRASGEYGEFLR